MPRADRTDPRRRQTEEFRHDERNQAVRRLSGNRILPPRRPGILHRHSWRSAKSRLGAGDADAHTPPYVLGLINLRGAVIPVIDMACRLGMKMTEPSERAAIIVTDIAGKLVGLLVEQVSDMMTIRAEDLQPAPEIIPEAQRAFCRGIVALEKSMVCFLNLDTVIADELAQAA